MKHGFAYLSILVALLFAVVPGVTAQDTPVTITFWEYYGGASGDFFETEADLFHEQYPGITVNIEHFTDQRAYREGLALAFESGNAPDAFIRRHTFEEMIENGWIQPLDPWITPEWVDRFPPNSFIEGRNQWEGKTYSFLTYAKRWDRILFINEDLFRQAGLVTESGDVQTPQTWGDLRTMARQITEVGNGEFYGIGLSVKDARAMSWWFDLAMLAGAPGLAGLDHHTGQYVFGTNPAFAQIVELLLGMKQDGSVYPFEGTLDDSNIYTFFAEGRYAIFMSGSYQISNLRRDFPDLDNFRAIPLPVPDEGRKGGMALVPTSHFFMSSQTQHPDETWQWLDWLSSMGFHERMVQQGLNFSIYPSANAPENITDPLMAEAFAAQTAYVVYEPYPPGINPQAVQVVPEPVTPDIGDILIGIYTGQIPDWRQALLDLDNQKQAAFDAAIQAAQAAGANVSLDDFIFPDWNPMEDYVAHSSG